MAIQKYLSDRYFGLSTDVKPTGVLPNATFYEVDTVTEWLYTGLWRQIGGSGTQGGTAVKKYYTGNIGNGLTSNFAIYHGLNTNSLTVQVNEMSGNNAVITNWAASGTNFLTLSFLNPPNTGRYSLTVIG